MTRILSRAGFLLVLVFVPVVVLFGAPATGAEPGWRSPVRPLDVQRGFDPPARDWLPGHRGVDLTTHLGQDVRAAGAGRVTFAALLAGRGVVVVDHGLLRTTYQPVAATVRVGDHVRAGALLGQVAEGAGHCSDGRCLHLGLRQGEVYLDPMLVLGDARAVLRPW